MTSYSFLHSENEIHKSIRQNILKILNTEQDPSEDDITHITIATRLNLGQA